MEVKPRNFRTGLYKFRTTPYGKLPVDEDLRRTIREGISGTSMPMFSHLREDDLAALIAYLKQLSRLWADPALMVSPMRVPEPPDWFSRPMDRAAHAKAGGARFSAQCAVCHGTEGKGDGPGGRGLFDAWEQPIRPADLTTPHPKSGDSPRDLFRTVATGLNGTPMAGFAPQLSEGEIWELVAWMESLRAGG
jgi:mono/diheme cytochrome c family protein